MMAVLGQSSYGSHGMDVPLQHNVSCLFDIAANHITRLICRHSAGTYDAETGTGGSNGAGMRYEAEGGDPANAGLQNARLFLEPVKAQHPWITYAGMYLMLLIFETSPICHPRQ